MSLNIFWLRIQVSPVLFEPYQLSLIHQILFFTFFSNNFLTSLEQQSLLPLPPPPVLSLCFWPRFHFDAIISRFRFCCHSSDAVLLASETKPWNDAFTSRRFSILMLDRKFKNNQMLGFWKFLKRAFFFSYSFSLSSWEGI